MAQSASTLDIIMDRVIYASYGSNMCLDRFSCYVRGGSLPGMNQSYEGCRNKELFRRSDGEYASLPLATNYELYFGRNNKHWDPHPHVLAGGANLDTTPLSGQGYVREFSPHAEPVQKFIKTRETIVRGHVVTRDQFLDIFYQENFLENTPRFDERLLDFANESHPILTLKGRTGANAIGKYEPIEIDIDTDYDALLYLGNVSFEGDSLPAYTFTSSKSKHEALTKPDEKHFLAPPSDAYFDILLAGLREIGLANDGWDDESLRDYLLSKTK